MGMKTDKLQRIVEYQTREQAQQAVNTLSNQNLMGRLVYVREVRYPKEKKTPLPPSPKNQKIIIKT